MNIGGNILGGNKLKIYIVKLSFYLNINIFYQILMYLSIQNNIL